MMYKLLYKEELVKILRTIIGAGAIKSSGTSQSYSVGDVMKYKNGDKYYLYKCLKNGSYSIPNENDFIKISLKDNENDK